MENEVVRVKYVFLDVVGYSTRTRDAQTHIVEALQKVVNRSVTRHTKPMDRVVYLPTGDGMCIALVGVNAPADVHMRIALSILEGISRHNQPFDPPRPPPPDDPNALDDSRWFEVRIGLNAGEDILYKGINERDNLAGEAINTAARVMDFADGGQILVGEAAYTDLHTADKYARSFKGYDVTFKHGRDTRVYQYRPERHREGLNVSPPSDIVHGINKFDSRADEKLQRQLLSAIENAKGTVWLLGVALSDEVSLSGHILRRIAPKVGKIDVRILLLDALRSPAVFRAFLEGQTQTRQFKEMAERERTRRRSRDSEKLLKDPYFLQTIYSTFERTLKALWEEMQGNPAYKMAVRYYAHTPLCWLVIADDTAYYQPYTFGRKEDASRSDAKSRTVGDQMPVFKIQREANADTFGVLKDHFRKLWLTSDSDLFQMGARNGDRDEQLYLIFRLRQYWFKSVGAVLRMGKDRRAYPRQPCTSVGSIVTIEWKDGKNRKVEVGAKIIDYSWVGTRLSLYENKLPKKGFTVYLKIIRGEHTQRAADYLYEEFLSPTENLFEVRWSGNKEGEWQVGLWAKNKALRLKPPKEAAARRGKTQWR